MWSLAGSRRRARSHSASENRTPGAVKSVAFHSPFPYMESENTGETRDCLSFRHPAWYNKDRENVNQRTIQDIKEGIMGLFDKKYCDVCGEKIRFLGNRKLEDGNLCKDCAEKLHDIDERMARVRHEVLKDEGKYSDY